MGGNLLAVKKITSSEEKSEICNKILRLLPQWFGIESAIVDYVKDIKTMETWASYVNDELAGFISINKHNAATAEIHIMGVIESFHKKGIGKILIKETEKYLAEQKFKYLTVKTLSELRADESYEKTRHFYLAVGFNPVEVFKTLWGEHNPCLLLIKNIEYRDQEMIAVMIHAPNWEKGFDWYKKAFPNAEPISVPDVNFKYLRINNVDIEIVNADEKVGAGDFGSVIYWKVLDFEKTKQHFESIGAILYRGPMKIENNQKMCQFKDPFGNLIGIRGF